LNSPKLTLRGILEALAMEGKPKLIGTFGPGVVGDGAWPNKADLVVGIEVAPALKSNFCSLGGSTLSKIEPVPAWPKENRPGVDSPTRVPKSDGVPTVVFRNVSRGLAAVVVVDCPKTGVDAGPLPKKENGVVFEITAGRISGVCDMGTLLECPRPVV
jgi:hypothetical protein